MSMLPVGFGASGDYTIEESLRFNASQSSYLSWTPASAGNRKTWTWSGWVKAGKTDSIRVLFGAYLDGSNTMGLLFNGDKLFYDSYLTPVLQGTFTTNAVFRDYSAWYHIVFLVDTTQATAANRTRLFVNGVEQTFSAVTYPSQNTDLFINSANPHHIGATNGTSNYFDGYLTEVNFIDGQALDASSFGEFDATTGVWKPKKYTGAYGTNGFFLDFSDATSATTLGYDYSGNSNNWTLNNFNTTSTSTAYCSMTDTPTPYLGGGNYAVLNPLNPLSSGTESDANLKTTLSANGIAYPTIPFPKSGKWYAEITCVVSTTYGIAVGVTSTPTSTLGTADSNFYGYYNANGNKYVATVASAYGSAWFGARTDVIGVAFDADTYELTMYLNGVSQGVLATLPSGREWFLTGQHWSGSGSHVENWNFGQRPFAYTPPTGFKALHTGNLPDSSIVDGSKHFDAKAFTFTNPTTLSTDFATDLAWFKARSNVENNWLYDAVRGYDKNIKSNTTDAEVTFGGGPITTTATSLTIPSGMLSVGYTYAGWLWKANGTGVSNTDGSITSTVSANPTAGFSIVTYTGTGSAATIGHGLGVAPSMYIIKSRDVARNWLVHHSGLTAYNYTLNLNDTSAQVNNDKVTSAPTSQLLNFSASNLLNGSGEDYIAYCFAEVESYSKFGSYLGNGSTDGPFVYTGFRPAFLLFKRTDSAADWTIHDFRRLGYNSNDFELYPNGSYAETGAAGSARSDFLSNGFKIRANSGGINASGGTYIYMAFSENPFKNSLAR